jgi:hypothetical protein
VSSQQTPTKESKQLPKALFGIVFNFKNTQNNIESTHKLNLLLSSLRIVFVRSIAEMLFVTRADGQFASDHFL